MDTNAFCCKQPNAPHKFQKAFPSLFSSSPPLSNSSSGINAGRTLSVPHCLNLAFISSFPCVIRFFSSSLLQLEFQHCPSWESFIFSSEEKTRNINSLSWIQNLSSRNSSASASFLVSSSFFFLHRVAIFWLFPDH